MLLWPLVVALATTRPSGIHAGGGLSLDGTRWVSCRPGFFLPVRVLLTSVQEAFDTDRLQFAGTLQHFADRHGFAEQLPASQTAWVVCAKSPFAGPDQVLDYVGRYTHRLTIGIDMKR